jgi:hypothetical protein
MEKITPQQALQNLYSATRVAPLTADQHELMRQSAVVLQELLTPKKENEKTKQR